MLSNHRAVLLVFLTSWSPHLAVLADQCRCLDFQRDIKVRGNPTRLILSPHLKKGIIRSVKSV